jgi:hypothetical protein
MMRPSQACGDATHMRDSSTREMVVNSRPWIYPKEVQETHSVAPGKQRVEG